MSVDLWQSGCRGASARWSDRSRGSASHYPKGNRTPAGERRQRLFWEFAVGDAHQIAWERRPCRSWEQLLPDQTTDAASGERNGRHRGDLRGGWSRAFASCI